MNLFTEDPGILYLDKKPEKNFVKSPVVGNIFGKIQVTLVDACD